MANNVRLMRSESSAMSFWANPCPTIHCFVEILCSLSLSFPALSWGYSWEQSYIGGLILRVCGLGGVIGGIGGPAKNVQCIEVYLKGGNTFELGSVCPCFSFHYGSWFGTWFLPLLFRQEISLSKPHQTGLKLFDKAVSSLAQKKKNPTLSWMNIVAGGECDLYDYVLWLVQL